MPIDTDLRPKSTIRDEVRTAQKDDAFEKLEELREDGRFHGRNVKDVAEEIGWSRQHVNNVIRDYYTKADDIDTLSIEIPADVNPEDYLRGYLAAMKERR